MTTAPLFSVVTPVYDPPPAVLVAAIESVLAQTYDDWELVLVDDASTDPEVLRTLRAQATRDPRVKVVERTENGHIVAASNDGIAEASGTFLVFLDHDDLLAPDALAVNARRIAEHDDVDYLYSDEDRIRDDGRFADAFHKPDWSPERLRSQNYCNHLSVLRTALVRELGGLREGFDGSQDHDLVLRVTERARRIVHIPKVLYHWRMLPGSAAGDGSAKPYALDAGRRAVQEHLDRTGIEGTVEIVGPGRYRTRRALPAERRVSIVIPTRGSDSVVWGRRRTLVTRAVRSALAATDHPNLEVVVVYDADTPETVLVELAEIAGERLVLVRYDDPFNYSHKVNLGVLASTGDRLLILNDDVEVRSEQWVEELLAPLEQPGVGLTGARLLFSSTAIQHVGLAFSHGRYAHPFRRSPGDVLGGWGKTAVVDREVSGVTGACMGIRREVYFEVGGHTELLREDYNDVDLCYKVCAAGYRILYLAHCELFHFESQTREAIPNPDDTRFMRRRWGIPVRDRYTPVYPNLPRPEDRDVRLTGARSRGSGTTRAVE
ncbi:glycosyltransferase [Nocardioides carbamazepini]|uniref:glycosyltransferase family 2 protein n=1 Tax=Nocardioides carbamazepini TaxID=2854259 RepID=UPI002149A1F4|nr:glycosyltransferase [Nocardioides carbamazepini]MCR1782668.1 glycosyltransferase [Nocardioides carbamazepini]